MPPPTDWAAQLRKIRGEPEEDEPAAGSALPPESVVPAFRRTPRPAKTDWGAALKAVRAGAAAPPPVAPPPTLGQMGAIPQEDVNLGPEGGMESFVKQTAAGFHDLAAAPRDVARMLGAPVELSKPAPGWTQPQGEKGLPRQMAEGAARSAPQLLPTIGMRLLPAVGIPAAGLFAFTMEAGPAYRDALKDGLSEDEAKAIGVSTGVINAGLEMVFPGTAAAAIKGVTRKELVRSVGKATMRVLKGMGEEGGTEFLQTYTPKIMNALRQASPEALKAAVLDPDTFLEGVVSGGAGALLGGAVGTAVEAGAQIPVKGREGEAPPQAAPETRPRQPAQPAAPPPAAARPAPSRVAAPVAITEDTDPMAAVNAQLREIAAKQDLPLAEDLETQPKPKAPSAAMTAEIERGRRILEEGSRRDPAPPPKPAPPAKGYRVAAVKGEGAAASVTYEGPEGERFTLSLERARQEGLPLPEAPAAAKEAKKAPEPAAKEVRADGEEAAPQEAPEPVQNLSPVETQQVALPKVEPEEPPLTAEQQGFTVGGFINKAPRQPEAAPPRVEPAPPKHPIRSTGKRDQVALPRGGEPLEYEWAAVDARDLVTSHDDALNENPAFPQDLQPRDRARAGSAAQVEEIARTLDPGRLFESATAADGAPIVGEDLIVESGNARTIALRRVYGSAALAAGSVTGPSRAARVDAAVAAKKYRAAAKAKAAELGVDLAGIQQPVLVRMRRNLPAATRAELARLMNESSVAQLSPAEQAASDSKRLTPESLDKTRALIAGTPTTETPEAAPAPPERRAPRFTPQVPTAPRPPAPTFAIGDQALWPRGPKPVRSKPVRVVEQLGPRTYRVESPDGSQYNVAAENLSPVETQQVALPKVEPEEPPLTAEQQGFTVGGFINKAPRQPEAAPPRVEPAPPKHPIRSTGKRETIAMPGGGERLEYEWTVGDIRDLVTSHDDQLNPRPDYDVEGEVLQGRDRGERVDLVQQIDQIEKAPDPTQLFEGATAAEGGPVVGEDRRVDGGNGRTIAIRRVYAAGGEKAANVRAGIAANAAKVGLDVEGIEQPWLYRRRTNMPAASRTEFAARLNAPTTAALSPAETAKQDARRITPRMIESLRTNVDGEVDVATSYEFNRTFMDALPSTERGGLMDKDGKLSNDGRQRIERAIVARAYPNADLLNQILEAADSNVRMVSSALLHASGSAVKLKDSIDAGTTFPELDITRQIVDAALKLSELRSAKMRLIDYMLQSPLTGDRELDPFTETILGIFGSHAATRTRFGLGENASAKNLGEILGRYFELAREAVSPTQGGLFGAPQAPDPEPMFERAARDVAEEKQKKQPDLFEQPSAAEAAMDRFVKRMEKDKKRGTFTNVVEPTPGGEVAGMGNIASGLGLRAEEGWVEQRDASGRVVGWSKSRAPNPEERGSLNLARRPEPALREGTRFEEHAESIEEAKKGIQGPPLWQRVAAAILHLGTTLSREQIHLPRIGQNAVAIEAFRRIINAPARSTQQVARRLGQAMRGLSAPQYDLFLDKLVLDNGRVLVERWPEGTELPFGITPAELEQVGPAIDAEVASSDKVGAAVVAVRTFYNEVREELRAAREELGLDSDFLDRQGDAYIHHQILEYAEGARRGLSRGARAPENRPFMRKLRGSIKAINLSYGQAQGHVLSQMLVDAEIARQLAAIRDRYDISDSLKKKAFAENEERLYAKLEKELGVPVERGGPKDILHPFRIRIAMANNKIARLAVGMTLKDGTELHLPEPPEQFGELDEELRDSYEEWLREREDMDPDEKKAAGGFTFDHPQWFPYLSWLVQQAPAPGSGAAAQIFVAIQDRNALLAEQLGKDYVNRRSARSLARFAGEKYAVYQPKLGSVFYLGQTVADKLVRKILDEGAATVTDEDLKEAMIRGGEREGWVLPRELVDALEEHGQHVSNSALKPFSDISVALTHWWQQSALIWPTRLVKYAGRNIVTDTLRGWAGNPSGLRLLGRAQREIQAYLRNQPGEPKAAFRGWLALGGLVGTQFETNLVETERRLLLRTEQALGRHEVLDIVTLKRYMRWARGKVNLLEGLNRFAHYLDYLEQLNSPEGLRNYGFSLPEVIDALPDNETKAYWLSNELIGAYDSISVLGQSLRKHAMPFWAFQELNTRQHYRLTKNITPRAARQLALRRLGAKAAAAPMHLAVHAGRYLFLASLFEATLWAWNHLPWNRDEEEQLTRNVKRRTHLVLGRNKDGTVRYFDRLSAFEEFRDFFGIDEFGWGIVDYLDGKLDKMDLALVLLTHPLDKLVNLVGPTSLYGAKTAFEMTTRTQLFPQAVSRGGTSIDDMPDYLASAVGLEGPFRVATKRPMRKDSVVRRLFLYEADPGSGAYYDVRQDRSTFLRQHGKGHARGSFWSPLSTALHYYKRARLYEDEEAAKKWLQLYVERGGTAKGMKQSFASMSPLYGLKGKEDEFREWLGVDGRERLDRAIEYYETIIRPAELPELPPPLQ